MQYSCVETIDLPRDRVIELLDNPDNLMKWQEGLQSFTHLSGDPGQPGAKSALVYQMGRRRVEMVETIEVRDLPDQFSAIYEAKGAWNRVINTFEDRGAQTHWQCQSEFRCSGMLKLMSWIMPGMFSRQTQKFMADFKRFAEAA